jgi:hypothetical protein
MTVAEMQLAVRLNLDKSTSLVGVVDFLPEELDFWLNEGQERFIKQRVYGTNTKQQSFDQTQKRIDDLKSLVVNKTTISLVSSSLGANAKECNLPITDATQPYLFYINSTVYDTNNNVLQTGDNISFELISKYLKDTINNPYIRRPLTTFYHTATGDKIVFIHGDEFIPTTCDITYFKKPKKLVSGTPGTYETNTCELPEHTHKEIVSDVVGLLIENIESQRSQTFIPINESKVE